MRSPRDTGMLLQQNVVHQTTWINNDPWIMCNFGVFFYTFLHFPILLYKRYALKTFKNRDLELLTRH